MVAVAGVGGVAVVGGGGWRRRVAVAAMNPVPLQGVYDFYCCAQKHMFRPADYNGPTGQPTIRLEVEKSAQQLSPAPRPSTSAHSPAPLPCFSMQHMKGFEDAVGV